jgi:hypothetical protein
MHSRPSYSGLSAIFKSLPEGLCICALTHTHTSRFAVLGSPVAALQYGDLHRYWDCDGDPSNGCETGPSVDPLNAHGTLGCVNQQLAILSCDSG